ncbi:MAG: hypothetical protein IJK71_09580 [Clostridia bacterium]|nr:hypothetical protein [Clostridia bacterium]
MKKIIGAVLLLVLLFALGCTQAEGKTTTLLVYMCGTDLQDAGCEDLVEMAEVEAGDAINVVVLAGGAKEWDLEDLKGNRRTLAVIRDGYFESLDDWGKGSMGDPDSLEEFLRYGLTEYPADRTIVVLWDHGAGSEGGVCFDETADDDGLTIAEINSVLNTLDQLVPGYHINIFGCDACMMATYEMAAMLSHHDIGYYVASEELEPGTGWYYTAWLDLLKNDPDLSDTDLCGAIIESYMDEGLKNDPDDYLTLSAVDLSKMSALETRMEQFASVMSGQIDSGNISAIRRGRSRMYTFGSFADGSWDMVDLGTALDAYAQFDSETAANVKRSLSEAVILSNQTANLGTCSGLSILIPQDTTESFDEYKDGFDLSDVIPNWVDFVNGYVDQLQGGSYHISTSSACQITDDMEFSDSFVSSTSWLFGGMLWDDEEECYTEDYEAEEYSIGDSDEGFTAVVSQEDLAYLDYVEGMLLMDMSDDEMECYVDFGLMQNNLIDWESGTVISLYDGTWPVFGGQPVPLYDQTSNEHSRRSLIPVKLNGEYTYLVVVFPAGGTEGRIVGANAGYDENGLPIRTTTRLKPGDEIIPVYTMYYASEDEEELQEAEFEGDKIIWQDGMTVAYEDLSDEEEEHEMLFCFIFNDIFGEDTMSDMISFVL